MELRCPSCGGLLYSQRSKICQCGAILPAEMVLSDEKLEAREKERQWARDLADAFDTTGRTKKLSLSSDAPASAQARYEAALAAPEELLRPVSCADEFKRRKRHGFWLVFVADAVVLLIIAFVFNSVIAMQFSWRDWTCIAIPMLFVNYMIWLRASPICPKCKQNIRTCPAEFCFVCGKPLRHRRCSDCGVDHSWTSVFRFRNRAAYQWIKHCPGCSVDLDTCIPRWLPWGEPN